MMYKQIHQNVVKQLNNNKNIKLTFSNLLQNYNNNNNNNNPLPLCNTIITKKTFVTTTRLSNNVDDQNDSLNYLDEDPNKSSKVQRFIRRETTKLEKNLYDTFNYQNVINKFHLFQLLYF